MNYRHAFHAGNFADVLKHAVLSVALEMVAAAVASCLASEFAGHQPAVATVATLPLASRPRRSVRWTPGVAAAAPDEAAGHERARPRIVR